MKKNKPLNENGFLKTEVEDIENPKLKKVVTQVKRDENDKIKEGHPLGHSDHTDHSDASLGWDDTHVDSAHTDTHTDWRD